MKRRAAPPAGTGPSVACPTCGKAALFAPANRWRPFCSERCRTTDLGAWAAEKYRIASRAEDDDAQADETKGE